MDKNTRTWDQDLTRFVFPPIFVAEVLVQIPLLSRESKDKLMWHGMEVYEYKVIS